MRLKWDQTGEKTYETGVSNGVLYPQKSDGSYDAYQCGRVWGYC